MSLVIKLFSDFLKLKSASGFLLVFTAMLAIIFANTSWNIYYELLLSTPVEIRIADLQIAKPLLLWINDGLMVIFFFFVGLELKRELIEGELADKRNIILPGAGAIGGMLVPALIYVYFNHNNEVAMKGWAIPTATDIAFALGVLSLLGSRVPNSIKVFLTSLAIFDDVGAILIIAFFYTAKISVLALIIVATCVLLLFVINRLHVEAKSVYIFIGIIMWGALLKSGVHATLSGVVLAMFIPMRSKQNPDFSPLKSMEHDLQALVSFVILPVFAFANAGVSFAGLGLAEFMHSVPIGIAAGLFLGKQMGVLGTCYLVIKLKWVKLPHDISWMNLYGTAVLCGIGFTMSLFIGSLAFEDDGVNRVFDERLGIITGSFLSALFGYFVLHKSLKNKSE